jgi:TldD protein
MAEIDETFRALPSGTLADAALNRAQQLGASHADFRLERIRSATISLRDGELDSSSDDSECGIAVRVIHNGAWGFASGIALTAQAAEQLAEQAVATARLSRVLSSEPVELAAEPVHTAEWLSSYEINPFDVAERDRIALLTDLSQRLQSSDGVDHVDAHVTQVQENKFYADAAGTRTTQQRVRIHPVLTGVHVDLGGSGFSSMRTLAPPAGRGWEYLTGTGYDLAADIAELPELLAAHAKAPSVVPGSYDLVIDPSNLWLTIHESIGHATELDRALGYEAAYAGTSFATPDLLGALKYGSEIMNITGDRTVEHGLSSIGYDDDGVATSAFDIVSDGVLVGYQLNRQMASSGWRTCL